MSTTTDSPGLASLLAGADAAIADLTEFAAKLVASKTRIDAAIEAEQGRVLGDRDVRDLTVRDLSLLTHLDAIDVPGDDSIDSAIASLRDLRTTIVKCQRRCARAGIETTGAATTEGK